ncbi:hypothetical protein BDV06DRAFT_217032 [Aspergillus oleicola]
MLRRFAGSPSFQKDMTFDRKISPSPSFLHVPMDSFGHGLPVINFDHRAMHIPSPETTTRHEQLRMGDHLGTDGLSSITSNVLPNGDFLVREAQASRDQYSPWHVSPPLGESAGSDISNTFSSRSTSQSSHCWTPLKTENFSPASSFTFDETSFNNANVPAPNLFHPAPRHSPYTLTSPFAPGKEPETTSAFGQTENPLPVRIPEGNRCTLRGSDWTSDDLLYQCLLQSQSTGTTPVTTTTDNHTATVTNNTYNPYALSSWPFLNTQLPCEVQQSTTAQCEGELAWDSAPICSGVGPQQSQIHQIRVTANEIDSLPCLGSSTETYVQPSPLLDSFGLASASSYVDGNTMTDPEHNQARSLGDETGSQSGFQRDGSMDSCFNIYGHRSCRSSHSSCMSPWTVDAKNALLLEYKRRGLSYKDIKRIGGFKEAESTLRGRYRTLTKSKEQRVRRPQWHENDIRLLREAVSIYSDTARYSDCLTVCRSRRPDSEPRVPWKKVAQYIWSQGGSYHFGNSTCKKKWFEVQGRGWP